MCFLEDERLSISVPEIVASKSYDLIVADGGYGWCLTRHLHSLCIDSPSGWNHYLNAQTLNRGDLHSGDLLFHIAHEPIAASMNGATHFGDHRIYRLLSTFEVFAASPDHAMAPIAGS